ncbi:MAG: EamA family transporter, partial [Lentisphaerota bacterium]
MNLMSPVVRERIVGYGSLLLAIILFSTIEVTSKMANAGVPPFWLAFIRFFFTGLILLAPALNLIRLRARPLTAHDWRILGGLGFIGVSVCLGLYHVAITQMRANVSAVIFSSNPAFVVLFSPWILGERPTRTKMAAVFIGLCGISIFVVNKGLEIQSFWGLLCLIGSLITFALYTVLCKKYMSRFGAMVITCFAGLLGSLLFLPAAWILEGNPYPALLHWPWWTVGYLTVVATALGYLAYFYGLVNVSASHGSMFFFLKPVLASLFAWLLLGEPVTWKIAAGTVLVLSSLVFALLPGPRRTVMPE